MAEIQDVEIENCIVDTEFNTRRELGDLTDLTASIKEHGVQDAISGKQNDNGTVFIFKGFRRLAAAAAAGLTKIPVKVFARRAVTQVQMVILNLVENVQREDLNPMDEAEGYQRLQKVYSLSTDEIATKIGIKKAVLQQRFRLLKLTDVVRDAVRENRINVTAAFEIDRLPKDKQGKYVSVAEELSGTKLKGLVDKELKKLDGQQETPGGDKEKDKDSARVTELVRTIRKAGSIMCTGLGYPDEDAARVKDVNWRNLEADDVQAVAKLFDDCADQVEDDIDVNEKATAAITEMVESTPVGRYLAVDEAIVRQVIIHAVIQRSQELAVEAASSTGRRPKVTFAMAENAISEFFGESPAEAAS